MPESSSSRSADNPPAADSLSPEAPETGQPAVQRLDRSVAILQLLTAAELLLLMAVTWRLWTPQLVFPRIPLFCRNCLLPPAGEWLVLAVLVLACSGRVGLSLLQLRQAAPFGGRLQRSLGFICCLCLLLLLRVWS